MSTQNKIRIEVFYPDFDTSIHNDVYQINYEVTYPDSTGNPITRNSCLLSSDNSINEQNRYPAIWRTSSQYTSMIFDFSRTTQDGLAELTITRQVYFNSGAPLTSTISINTAAEDESGFNVITQTSTTPSVHNKIAVTVMDIMTTEILNSSTNFKTEF
jgi:hypothetical protein